MEEYTIKQGEYSEEKDVVIQIVKTTVETKTETTEITEDLLNKTIDFLNEKKKNLCDEIDSEIAINQNLLDKIKSIDRSQAIVKQ